MKIVIQLSTIKKRQNFPKIQLKNITYLQFFIILDFQLLSKMDETQYYEELDNLIGKLKKAKDDNDHDKITRYINSLNELWKKGSEVVIKNVTTKLQIYYYYLKII